MKLRSFGGMLFAAMIFVAGSHVFAAQFSSTATTVNTSELFTSPDYVANGSITVNVIDGPDCDGAYTVNATPLPNSGPNASTPPSTSVVTYLGFGEGAFLFANAGVGEYTITITQTSNNGDCFAHDLPANPNLEQFVVEVNQKPITQGGAASSINPVMPTPQPQPTNEDEAVDATDETDTDEPTDEDEMTDDEESAEEEESMDDEAPALTSESCQDDAFLRGYEAGETMTLPAQVRVLVIRFLEKATSADEKDTWIKMLVCRIAEIKETHEGLSDQAHTLLYSLQVHLLGHLSN